MTTNSNAAAETIAEEIRKLEEASKAREQRAERDALQPPSVGRLRSALASARAAGAQLQRIEITTDVAMGDIDPQLQPAVGAARRAAVRAEKGKQASEVLDQVLAEIGAAREGSESLVDARAHRRRATFDPAPVADATVRAAWISRLSRVSVGDLLDFASLAIEQRSVALASAIEEELAYRDPIPADRPTDREAAAQAHRRIATLVPPAVGEAQQLLLDLDATERELKEAARIISGGVPSGTSEITVGLLRQQAATA